MSSEHKSWPALRDEFLAEDPERAAAIRTETALVCELGQRIHDLRTARGWTQQQLADACGMRQPHIARLELGGTNPTLGTVARIAAALGTAVHVVFDTAA